MDFAFLAAQTFDDRPLQRDVLGLFVAQVRRVVPALSGMTAREQTEAAHLLVGSARGIGARDAAAAAETYGAAADPSLRRAAAGRLAASFTAAIEAIEAHLAATQP